MTVGTAPGHPLIDVEDVEMAFYSGRSSRRRDTSNVVHAVRGVNLQVFSNESVALVGESGSGKSTLARIILGIEQPTVGSVRFQGEDVYSMSASRRRLFRGEIQMVFQDPFASLNPRMKVRDLIGEAWDIQGTGFGGPDREAGVAELVQAVGLNMNHLDRFPSAFSGGQRQRIAIARALAIDPSALVCDEPVSALDVSVQAQILNLLKDLQGEHQLTLLLISHDLTVVRQVADRVYVMQNGKIVESGSVEAVLDDPQHEYTQTLLRSSPGQKLP